MTKQDFELIAATLRSQRSVLEQQDYTRTRASDAAFLESLAGALASALQTTNSRFDRKRFLRACGVES